MDNIKEISLEDLSSISGGTLTEKDIKIIDWFIEFKKITGSSLEEALQGTVNPEAKEYIKAHW